jgi:hypothetical protein
MDDERVTARVLEIEAILKNIRLQETDRDQSRLGATWKRNNIN